MAVNWTIIAMRIYLLSEREILNCRLQKNLLSITRAVIAFSTSPKSIRKFKSTLTQRNGTRTPD